MVDIHFRIEKKHLYFLGLFVLILIGAGLIYSYGGTNPSVMGHSAGELNFSGIGTGVISFNSVKDVQHNLTQSCPAGSSIRVISTSGTVTCETDDVGSTGPVSTGLYGWCADYYEGGAMHCQTVSPAYCTGTNYCACPSGYTIRVTGLGVDDIQYHSCYRN